MSIVSVTHENEAMGGAVMQRLIKITKFKRMKINKVTAKFKRMKITKVTAHLSRLIFKGKIDHVRFLTNQVISDPEMHEHNVELVSYCNTIQTWLIAQDLKKVSATVSEAKENSVEALGTAVAAQSGVTMLENSLSDLVARIAALEETSKQKEGQDVIRKGREIHCASRTTSSMSELAKKAGQKVIQDQREKKEAQESFQKREQMRKDMVLTFSCGILHLVEF